MNPIIVHHRHDLGLVGARQRAEKIAHRLQNEHGGSFEWDGNTLRFKRTGIGGHVTITDDDVEVRVDVGVLLLAFRARIEREIRTFLDRDLATPAGPQRARTTSLRSAPTKSSRSQGGSRSPRPN